jgi:hypothetical protein
MINFNNILITLFIILFCYILFCWIYKLCFGSKIIEGIDGIDGEDSKPKVVTDATTEEKDKKKDEPPSDEEEKEKVEKIEKDLEGVNAEKKNNPGPIPVEVIPAEKLFKGMESI